MVNWNSLVEVPIGVLLLYVAAVMLSAIEIPLFGELSNSSAHPLGATVKVLIGLVLLLLAVMVIYSAYRSFREPGPQSYY